jgi:flagellar motor protein MotB
VAQRFEAQTRELTALRLRLEQRERELADLAAAGEAPPTAVPPPAAAGGGTAEAPAGTRAPPPSPPGLGGPGSARLPSGDATARVAAAVRASMRGLAGVELVGGESVVLTASQLFELGEAALSPAGEATLAPVAERLRRVVEEAPAAEPWALRVDGHTDDTPIRRSRYRSNWELSAARASAVAEYLVRSGVPSGRLMVAGLADTAPIARGRDERSRQRNRRIELRVTPR